MVGDYMSRYPSAKKNIFTFLLVVVLSLVSVFVPLSAYAGTSDSNGNGGGYGYPNNGGAFSAARSIQWHPWNNYIKGEIGGTAANSDIGVYLIYARFSDYNWARWGGILATRTFGYGGGHSGSAINPYKGWDGRLNQERERNGFVYQYTSRKSYGGERSDFYWFVSKYNDQLLDACWLGERTIEKDEPKKVITYTDGGTGGNHIDDRDKSAEWLFNNGKTSDTYYDKTGPTDYSHRTEINATVQIVNKHTKIVQKTDSSGNWYDVSNEVTYSKGGVKKFNKNIDYSVTTPAITQESYKPYNLNRNGYATSEDGLSSQYTGDSVTGLEATVNNNQGITDNSFINALDINSNTNFTFRFNNNYFGMPSKYNWANTPAELANGTWEDAGEAYANNKNGVADSDGMLRYNLTFNASMTTNTKNGSVDSSSLKLNGDSEETLASQTFSRKLDGSAPFMVGEWSARFTYADKYYTDNNISSKFGNWWLNTYSQGRFYEYGTEFWGNITTDGISDPNKITYGDGESNSDGSYKITTNADKEQRGFYVGLASQNFEQPVLIGKWEVKTVAGDIN